MGDLLNNKYFSILVPILIISYNCLFEFKLPDFMVNLANNPIIKIIILTLIGFLGSKNLQLSLFFSIAFVLIISLVNNNNLLEGINSSNNNNN